MIPSPLQTPNLRLLPQTRDQVLAYIAQLPPHEKKEVSPAWLALLENSSPIDPWIHGFTLVLRADNTPIGKCGFKGPPTPDRIVEIAYAVDPEYQGKGYATEAADALVAYAFASGQVQTVRAHTLPEPNASTRVLTKCGFHLLGQVLDPDDGPVWRWARLSNS